MLYEVTPTQVTIRGVVMDAASGETLPGAHVYTYRGGELFGTTTDNDGRFVFTALEGDTITVSFLGFAPVEFPASETPPGEAITVRLSSAPTELDTVEIFPDPANGGLIVAGVLAALVAVAVASDQ